MLSVMDWPRQSKISSCTPIAANVLISPAMSSGSPEKGRRDPSGDATPDGSRRTFSGEPEDIAGDIRAFAAIGVHELIFDCRGQSIAESIERLQWFATDVIPLVDG